MTISKNEMGSAQVSFGWLRAMRVYLAIMAIGNLTWEFFQLPLYTIWTKGTLREQVLAVVHCTLGDLLIALTTLTLALVLAGEPGWPGTRFRQVAILTIVFGVGYTVFSEWLNVVVRAAWAYSDRMPVISFFGLRTGLSPLLQWIVVPVAAFKISGGVTVDLRNGDQR